MFNLPNPFQSAPAPAMAADAGRCPGPTDPSVAAASHFESRFVLDEEAFMNDIQPLPAFLSNPSPEYLRAAEIMPIVEVLAGH